MGVVTSIAMATVAVGGAVYKGVQAGNASTVAAREAGTLRLQQAVQNSCRLLKKETKEVLLLQQEK